MNKKFFFNLLKEGVGYESGFLRTVVDLYKNPQKVVEASATNDLTYVNPVKFMVMICSYFVVFNGFIVDWEKVFLGHFTTMNYYITGSTNLGEFEVTVAKWTGFAYTNGFVPLAIFILIFQLYLLSKKIKNYSYSMDYHKDVVFYYHGLNNLLYFGFSIFAALLPPSIFLIFTGILTIISLLGFRKFIELKPIAAYFSQEKSEMTALYKGVLRKVFIFLTSIGMIIGLLVGFFSDLLVKN